MCCIVHCTYVCVLYCTLCVVLYIVHVLYCTLYVRMCVVLYIVCCIVYCMHVALLQTGKFSFTLVKSADSQISHKIVVHRL